MMEGKKEMYSREVSDTLIIGNLVRLKMIYITTGNRKILTAARTIELAYCVAMSVCRTGSIDYEKLFNFMPPKHLQYPKPEFAKGGIIK